MIPPAGDRPGDLDIVIYKGDTFTLPITFGGVAMAGTWRAQMRLDAPM